MRFVAAIAVVWIHTPNLTWWSGSTSASRFAVPLFALASAYAMVGSARARPTSFGAFVIGRFTRLYVPFLAWNFVYLAARVLKHGGDMHKLEDTPLTFLLVGTAQQLWFLPFLLLAQIVAIGPLRWALGTPARERIVAGVLVGLGVGVCVARAVLGIDFPIRTEGSGDWRGGLALGFEALPAFCWGLAGALWLGKGLGSLRAPAWLGWLGLLVAVAALAIGWRPIPPAAVSPLALACENIAGVGVFVFALWLPAPAPPSPLAALGGLAFGVYLSHVLFIQACNIAAARLHVEPSLGRDLATLAIASIGGAVLTWLLLRSARTRWLVA